MIVNPRRITRESAARIPTDHGTFRLVLYREHGKEHLAAILGEPGRSALVRVHSECFTGDVLGSLRCDCGDQLARALRRIAADGAGIVVYLRQEGRGIGLAEKLRAYNLQDLGYDTVDANRMLGHADDARDYWAAAAILRDLGVRSVRLLSNNPAKVEGLEAAGMRVAERLALTGRVTGENHAYLRTKVARLRHLLDPAFLRAQTARPPVSPEADGDGSLPVVIAEDAADALLPSPARGPRERPFVTLSYAQSLDGSIAAHPGRPLTLSGADAMTLTHRLRAVHRGILVGIGTVLADDPRLTVRRVDAGRDPEPVVLDSALRTPPRARLLRGRRRAWIAAGPEADAERERRLTAAGARVLRLPTDGGGRIRLDALLHALRERGMGSLMVEGGGQVITSFLAARLVDHLVITLAPTLVGGVRAVGSLTVAAGDFPRLEGLRHRRVGEDLVLSGRPRWSDRSQGAAETPQDEQAAEIDRLGA